MAARQAESVAPGVGIRLAVNDDGQRCQDARPLDSLGFGGALAALLLAVGGAVAAAIIAATHKNDILFGGSVTVVSPTK